MASKRERPLLHAVGQLGDDHHPFGLAQRRLLDVVTNIYIGNPQLAELVRHGRILARHAVEQHQVDAHGHQQLEVQVRVVTHVAHLAAELVGGDVVVGDVVDARDPDDALHLAQQVEHRHMARRHADNPPYGSLDHLSRESGRHRLAVAYDVEVLHLARAALPGVADRYERAGTPLAAADIEARRIAGRVALDREILHGEGS